MTAQAQVATAGPQPSGSIYDLGYRHYEGERRGRLWAAWSLYVESLRGIWGFGRPATAKAAPFIIAGLYLLPAAFQLAFSSIIAQEVARGGTGTLLTYGNYFGGMGSILVLFLIAQAPEVVCRDQRYQVLPLYFTRPMGRPAYALARLASLATALFLVLMAPVVAIFVGDVLMATDTLKAVGDELPRALPTLPSNALIGFGLAAIALAVSSFSPRRAYAAIGVLAYFLLMEAVPMAIYAIGSGRGAGWSDYLPLLTPDTALTGANHWFFGTPVSEQFPATIGAGAYVVAGLVSLVLFTGILLNRYRSLSA
jgi:ABC-2 type transport system permease protein